MGFQQQAYTEQALMREGIVSRLNPLTTLPMVAEGKDVKVGKFGFTGTISGQQVIGFDEDATSVEGVVVFGGLQLGASIGNTLDVNEGQEVAIVTKGFVSVRPTTASVRKQSVFVNPADGEIRTGTKGATITDFFETEWVVETGASANQVCEITR